MAESPFRSPGRGGEPGSLLERLSRASASLRARARGRRAAERSRAEQAGNGFVKPVTGRSGRTMNPGCMAAFFGVFLLAGLGFTAVFAVPAYRVLQARSWDAVPCEILESRVVTHSDSDGDTYSVGIRYRYEIWGATYEGDRYTFLGGSSSGYEGKREVVERFPAGSRATCWVNPEDPTDAVFERGFTWTYLVGLFPLIFVAVGGGGMLWAARSWLGRRRSRLAAAGAAGAAGAVQSAPSGPPALDRAPHVAPHWLPESRSRPEREPVTPTSAAPAEGPVVLESTVGPVGKFFGTLFIALFWNGIVSVFVWQVWKGWRAGQPDGCLTIFLIPFVLVGLLLVVGVPYQFLAMFNPRPRLRLASGRLTLGGSTDLSWSFRGRAGRIRRLTLTLEGVEKARYRRGTDTHTATETFATLEVAEVTQPTAIRSGSTLLEVPADTMHSFDGGNNQLVWSLKIHGEIRLWPDVLEEFPLVVRPLPPDALGPLDPPDPLEGDDSMTEMWS